MNGAGIGIISVSVIDILLQYLEHRDANLPFTWESFNGRRTAERGALGGIAGGFLGYGFYNHKIAQEAKLPFDPDAYLSELLKTEQLSSDPKLSKKMNSLSRQMKMWLWNEFKTELVKFPEGTGSLVKKLALASWSDIDLLLPFSKKKSRTSIEETYKNVYKVVTDKFAGKAKVSRNTRSIRLLLSYDGDDFDIDIVPGKEINDYRKDGKLNLYVNPRWPWQNGGRFKTDANTQKSISSNDPNVRATIMLLKLYNNINGLDISPLVIETHTVNAFSRRKYAIQNSITENLLIAMEHLSDKITNLKLEDPANSNNNLHRKITSQSAEKIVVQLRKDIYRIESNPQYIKEIFL